MRPDFSIEQRTSSESSWLAGVHRGLISLFVAVPVCAVVSLGVAFYSGPEAYATGKLPGITVIVLPFLLVWSKTAALVGYGTLAVLAGCLAQLLPFFLLVHAVASLVAWRKSAHAER